MAEPSLALYSVVFCHQMFARFGSGLMTSAATAAALSIGLLVRRGCARLADPGAASAIVALVPAIWILVQQLVRRANGIGLWIL